MPLPPLATWEGSREPSWEVGPAGSWLRAWQGYGGHSLILAILAEQGAARGRGMKEATWDANSLGTCGTRRAVVKENQRLTEEGRLNLLPCAAPPPSLKPARSLVSVTLTG